jgi:DeoR/GlpR family transcriptional regulator of sugar metabolism
MIARADELIILADSSKFGLSGVFGVCPLEQISILVTDAAPEGALAGALKQAGTEILIAS